MLFSMLLQCYPRGKLLRTNLTIYCAIFINPLLHFVLLVMNMEFVCVIKSDIAIDMLALQKNRFGYDSRMLTFKMFTIFFGKREFFIAHYKLAFVSIHK